MGRPQHRRRQDVQLLGYVLERSGDDACARETGQDTGRPPILTQRRQTQTVCVCGRCVCVCVCVRVCVRVAVVRRKSDRTPSFYCVMQRDVQRDQARARRFSPVRSCVESVFFYVIVDDDMSRGAVLRRARAVLSHFDQPSENEDRAGARAATPTG